MRTTYWKWLVSVSLIVLLGYSVVRWWQGPQVKVHEVMSRGLVQTVVASGRISNQVRVDISSELTGLVQQRLVNEGDVVHANQPLIRLRAADLVARSEQVRAALATVDQRMLPQAEAEVEQAQIALAQAQREASRRQRLAAQNLVTAEAVEQALQTQDLAELNLAKAQSALRAVADGGAERQGLLQQLAELEALLEKAEIRAPASAIVLTKHVEAGDVVQPGSKLLTLALDGQIEVRAALDERNLPLIAVGQSAQIIADAYPQQPFAAQVNFIAPSIDAQRGTVEVRLLVTEQTTFLKQDMTVSVTIETAKREAALVVPNEAIYNRVAGQQPWVWLVRNGELIQQPVQLGLQGLTATEISSGLAVSELIVLEAPADLEKGQRVRVKLTHAD